MVDSIKDPLAPKRKRIRRGKHKVRMERSDVEAMRPTQVFLPPSMRAALREIEKVENRPFGDIVRTALKLFIGKRHPWAWNVVDAPKQTKMVRARHLKVEGLENETY